MRGSWLLARWRPVAALRDDGRGHGVKGGSNLRPPSSRNTRRPLRSHDDPLMLASKMEGQALGLGNWVGCDPREKIELRIELGHVDLDGCVVRLFVLQGIELGAITFEPRADFGSVKPFETGP